MKTFHKFLFPALVIFCILNVTFPGINFNEAGITTDRNVLLAQDINSVWTDIPGQDVRSFNPLRVYPLKFRNLNLNLNSLRNILAAAPFEFTDRSRNSRIIIELPKPDGSLSKFYVTEYSMMEPGLSAQFPEIKTYNIKGIDDPYASGKIDLTMTGFHGMVLTVNGDYFIDPVSPDNTESYISFYKSDYKSIQSFECLVNEVVDNTDIINSYNPDMTGQQLRTYRLACAASGEYTVFHGGTVALGQAAIVTAINRVNGVYEKDVSVRMTLVANNTSIVYTNAATDPYSNTSSDYSLNQAVVDGVIGTANYDIGHVFNTGGGGVAGLGVVCVTSSKARGCTGLPSPIGDPFYIDYVAHEMGHQFRGNHTFNGNAGACAGNRNASTAWEPGSGSTIMPYAGICGAQDLQPNSDAYFHTGSVSEIAAFTQTGNGNNCPVITVTGNTPPTVTVPAGGFTIPISTPFALTGSATDTETPGSLTYCWEEFDLGPAGAPGSPSGNAPIFRSFTPVVSPSRTFPKLSDLLNNTSTIGEILPSYTRALTFRLTVRDNAAGGGGINFNTVAFNVSNTSGPFVVTQPNTAVSWNSGTQTINWNVANTTDAPVSCALVNIKLSTDGGSTFPTTLLSNTSNDGSEIVILPNIASTTARIKVESSGNIFFDISNSNFTINYNSVTPCEDFTSLSFPPSPLTVEFTGTSKWERSNVSAYGIGSGSALFKFINAFPGTVQSLVSNNFTAVGLNSYLTFDEAYAPFGPGFGPDTLVVEASDNSGASYSVLATLTGKADGTGELNTAPPIATAYVPSNSEWRPKIYSLPAGTNKVRLKAKSGFGNNLYIDNFCVQTLPAPVTSFLCDMPEGFYRPTPSPNVIADTIRIYLRRTDFPNVTVDSVLMYNQSGGCGNFVFGKALSGNFHMVIKHRNSLETWTNAGVPDYTRGSSFSYDLISNNSIVYGSNQVLVDPLNNFYGNFSGDIDGNGFIDLTDVTEVFNSSSSFASGYIITDVTGDNVADLTDVLTTFNNNTKFVTVKKPAGARPLK